jgi:hypothetical protein
MFYVGFQLDNAHVPQRIQPVLEGFIWFVGLKVWFSLTEKLEACRLTMYY